MVLVKLFKSLFMSTFSKHVRFTGLRIVNDSNLRRVNDKNRVRLEIFYGMLVDEDIEAYLSGELIFYNINDNSESI